MRRRTLEQERYLSPKGDVLSRETHFEEVVLIEEDVDPANRNNKTGPKGAILAAAMAVILFVYAVIQHLIANWAWDSVKKAL